MYIKQDDQFLLVVFAAREQCKHCSRLSDTSEYIQNQTSVRF
jgi:hypothetical protein